MAAAANGDTIEIDGGYQYRALTQGGPIQRYWHYAKLRLLDDLLAGTLDCFADQLTSSMPHIKSGKFRVLGVMGAQRLSQAPDGPTFKEQGYNFEMASLRGLAAPKGLQPAVRERLVAAIEALWKHESRTFRAVTPNPTPRDKTVPESTHIIDARTAFAR